MSNPISINRKQVEDTFHTYTESYDLTDVKIALKAAHTYRVAALCERIAKSLSLPPEDVDLAWLLGMLHDLGRFEQVRRFGSFDDPTTVNHAVLSADLLFRDGLIRSYVSDDREDPLIEKAIRLHNVYALPQGLTKRERMFCQILRDADKLDIFRVNVETPLEEILNVTTEDIETSPVSKKVLADAILCRNCDRRFVATPADHIVSHISLVFGLVYDESIRIVKEQGYLDQLLAFRSRNPETNDAMEQVRGAVHTFFSHRLP